jgi:Leucine-rich repeat (LRR) protein
MGIEKIDSLLSKMSNLRILNLSYNKITVLPSCLPPKLEELNLTGNSVSEIAIPSSSHFPTLIHLGLSYNAISDSSLSKIVSAFPKLFCLDLSHNRLESIKDSIKGLASLSDLKMLYLQGNPLMLVTGYRNTLKTKLPKLKILDGVATLNEAEGGKKKKKAAGSALSTYGVTA